jgi:hypothetical protein
MARVVAMVAMVHGHDGDESGDDWVGEVNGGETGIDVSHIGN